MLATPNAPHVSARIQIQLVQVMLNDQWICSGHFGDGLKTLEIRASETLGVPCQDCKILRDDSEGSIREHVLELTALSDPPQFSDRIVSVSMLSGKSTTINPGAYVGAVYGQVAREFQCKPEQLRLIYRCSHDCQFHTVASSKCAVTSGDVTAVLVAEEPLRLPIFV